MDMEKLSRAVQQAKIMDLLVETGLLSVEETEKVKGILGKDVRIFLKEELTEK